MAWAREEFRLDRPDTSGTPLRAHLQAAGVEQPNPKPFPEAAAQVWEWFMELATGRTAGLGPNPLTWEGIAAWCDLTGNRPAPWEVRAIKALDLAFLAAHHKGA